MVKIIVETRELNKLLKSVKNYISKDKNRTFYSNIKIECFENNFRIIACDGYKLIYNQCETKEARNCTFIIPYFTVPKNAEDNTIFILEDENVNIDFGCYKIIYKTIKDAFIDYRAILDKSYDSNYKIGFQVKLLKQALASFETEVVEFNFDLDSNISSVIIRSINNKNKKALVLPYKIREV